MTREEALKYLPWLPDTKHTMTRRALYHNYSAPGLYMLTIVVKDRRPLLGSLQAGPQPRVEWTPLGRAIVNHELPKISQLYPMVEVWQHCIMPDHIHLILYVRDKLPPKKHLGNIIGGFKSGCTRCWWQLMGFNPSPEHRTHNPLFEENYNDRLLHHPDQLDIWKQYLRDNPRRLALKRQNPHLFTTLHQYPIDGRPYNICGNRFLLDIPDIMAVVVHRRDSEEEYQAHCKQWLACGERGGVLVSAAVAKREKAVMRIAMERGYNLILLRENGFPPLYKPAGEAFDACAQGRLLQISPWDYHTDQRTITRAQCLQLNAIAEALARRHKGMQTRP